MTNFLFAAQFYRRVNIPIFPVHMPLPDGCSCNSQTCPNKGKHPRITGFYRCATLDMSQILQWASFWPQSNVGMPTGHPWRYVVIDVDPRHGGERSLDDLQRKFGFFPPTIETITGSGGRHYFFNTPKVELQNSSGKIAPGVDVRGHHGFVVVPPSLHASGNRYEWVAGHAPDEIAAAAMPAWLIDSTTAEVGNALGRRSDWRQSVLRKIGEGERNAAVAKLVGHLLRRRVDPYVVLEIALSWNRDHCLPPLDDREVVAVVDSIAKSELARRRH